MEFSRGGQPTTTRQTIRILVDSSTKPSSKTCHYGESTVCWATYTDETIPTPTYVGLIYRQRAGPNRIFYIGIIRALEELFEAGWLNYSLKVQGDCKAVINQLNEIKWHPVDMKDLYDQVRSLEDKLKSVRRAQIEYEYLDESDSVYQKIDQCAKRGRAFIRERLF